MNPCKNKISLDPNPEYMTGDRDRVVEMVVVVVGVWGRHGREGVGVGGGRLGDALNDLCSARQREQSRLMFDEGVQMKKTSTDMQS